MFQAWHLDNRDPDKGVEKEDFGHTLDPTPFPPRRGYATEGKPRL